MARSRKGALVLRPTYHRPLAVEEWYPIETDAVFYAVGELMAAGGIDAGRDRPAQVGIDVCTLLLEGRGIEVGAELAAISTAFARP